jgi:hypothetical protein
MSPSDQPAFDKGREDKRGGKGRKKENLAGSCFARRLPAWSDGNETKHLGFLRLAEKEGDDARLSA